MQIRDVLKDYNSNDKISRMESELLLAHVLNVTRSYLYLHFAENVPDEKNNFFRKLVQRRQQGEPLAYILGNCEFWDLQFAVNKHVLIPRPETELLVEITLQSLNKQQPLTIADLGTGSGAVSLALAHECHNWHIYATDNSAEALQVARSNIKNLELTNVTCYHGEWCDALPARQFAAIVSNPPYIATDDPYVQDSVKQFEPACALFAGEDGLAAIKKIISQAPQKLAKQGWLMFEHGFQQGASVKKLMLDNGFVNVTTHKDLAGHDRVTAGHL